MPKLRGSLLITLVLLFAISLTAMGSGTAQARTGQSTYTSNAQVGRVTLEGEPDIGLGVKPQQPKDVKSGVQTQRESLIRWAVGIWVAQYLWR